MKITSLIFPLLLLLPLITVIDASALTPEDLVIVYNSNMPASKNVAEYYSAKRGVPLSNLVGVNVTEAERISRENFDSNIVFPVQKKVTQLKRKGFDPAILLVYGIPLRIRERDNKKREREYHDLVNSKIVEYKGMLLSQMGELKEIINSDQDKPRLKLKSNYDDTEIKYTSIQDISDALKKIVNRALVYLRENRSRGDVRNREKITSLLFRITGMSPIVGNVAKQFPSMTNNEVSFLKKSDPLYNIFFFLKKELARIPFRGIAQERYLETASIIRMVNGLNGEMIFWNVQKDKHSKKGPEKTTAAVDSELTLLLDTPHQLAGWLHNPFLRKYDKVNEIERIRASTIMVGRLDASTPEMAKRLVDDAIETEKTSLTGTFYIDARGMDNTENSYGQYDERLRKLYETIKDNGSYPVVLDNKPELFPPGSGTDAALYAGWYSLAKYVDSFKWKKGAVAFHIASSEASTLKKTFSQVWCKRLIEEGVAATLGPVSEPYLASFPLPELFFPLLIEGKLTLLEVYYLSTPYLSWQQIIIGDPLYRPFKSRSRNLIEN